MGLSIACVALVVLGLAARANAAAYAGLGFASVLDYLDENTDILSNTREAAIASGLADGVLSSSTWTGVLLAPTNEAWRKFDAKSATVDLTDLIKYHIITLSSMSSLNQANGKFAGFSTLFTNHTVWLNRGEDARLQLIAEEGCKTTSVSTSPVMAGRVLIYLLDEVLLPQATAASAAPCVQAPTPRVPSPPITSSPPPRAKSPSPSPAPSPQLAAAVTSSPPQTQPPLSQNFPSPLPYGPEPDSPPAPKPPRRPAKASPPPPTAASPSPSPSPSPRWAALPVSPFANALEAIQYGSPRAYQELTSSMRPGNAIVALLTNSSAELTIFAPVDSAFDALDSYNGTSADGSGADSEPARWLTIVQRHIVPGPALGVGALKDEGVYAPLDKTARLVVSKDWPKLEVVCRSSRGQRAELGRAKVVRSNVAAGAAIIHFVDALFLEKDTFGPGH